MAHPTPGLTDTYHCQQEQRQTEASCPQLSWSLIWSHHHLLSPNFHKSTCRNDKWRDYSFKLQHFYIQNTELTENLYQWPSLVKERIQRLRALATAGPTFIRHPQHLVQGLATASDQWSALAGWIYKWLDFLSLHHTAITLQCGQHLFKLTSRDFFLLFVQRVYSLLTILTASSDLSQYLTNPHFLWPLSPPSGHVP